MPPFVRKIHNSLKEEKRGGLLASIVWFSAALFYLYEYLVRVAPSVMIDELEFTFQVPTGDLSTSLASYYYIYAPMQLLVGVLFDRYGGRRLLVPATFIVAIGCFLATFHEYGLWALTLGRILMGFGSAFGFVGVIYLATVWYPSHRIALLAGLTTALGMVGAIMGEAFLAGVVDEFGWMFSFEISGYFGLALGIALIFIIPKAPSWELERREQLKIEAAQSATSFWNGLKIVLINPQTWIIGFTGAALYLTISLFGELWGVSYVVNVLEVKKTTAAGAISMLFLGFLVGGPILGWISDHYNNRKAPLFWGCIGAAILFFAIFLIEGLSLKALYFAFFAVGFVSAAEIVCFVAGIEANPSHLKGTAVAAVNMIVTILGGVLQSIVGYILDLRKSTELINTGADFQFALLLMPASMILGALLCLFIKKAKQS